ncbi:MAG: HNH endonuclease [candidate division KSB1 bacterium]|nr:HNH endonuclease [candidate division KSB1 bacterium]
MMEKALFINGVFKDVLDEIMRSQNANPGKTFYLQPYAESTIKRLKQNPPAPESPLPLYISTTAQLNQICYSADIIGWEDKNQISNERLAFLNDHIKRFQPKENEIYFEMKGKKCVNLISIRNLVELPNQLSTLHLVKESNGEPLKKRSRSGGWSYVFAPPFLKLENSYINDRLDAELGKKVSVSLQKKEDFLEKRLAKAEMIPEKVQIISSGFRRNPDVIAFVLKRSKGKCELCGCDASFDKKSDGKPYLEVHHWITLSEGGEDTIENAAALCPNCHKRAHFGQEQDFLKIHKELPKHTEM